MKYRVLLKFLQFLVYLKRFFWKVGAGLYFVVGFIAGGFTKLILLIRLRILFFLKKMGISQSKEWIWKRDFVQLVILAILFVFSIGQTKIAGKKDLSFVGQKTLVYTLAGASDEIQLEEELAPLSKDVASSYSWKTGALIVNEINQNGEAPDESFYLGSAVAGGSALSRPIIISRQASTAKRTAEVNYIIQPGDSLSSIAYEFGISVNTVLWNNNLTLRSVLRPGATLAIPPVDGVVHVVKKGDTLTKIASLYKASAEEITEFNNLGSGSAAMKVGERIIIPNGTKQITVATVVSARNVTQSASRGPTPPNSSASVSTAGYVWPSSAHVITQYYGLSHHALDIAGPWQSAIYATKSGVVVTSQCGWNSGYGCYIIIDHGGGVKSLYGHNSKLLVSVGDQVETGQTIALMGNTGKVRGLTGIHSHFEIIVNGARVNPLRYVK